MIIEDNGKGFDTQKLNSFEGIGLKNIISRVQFLNGSVDFDSTIGNGTTVNIEIPL
jgi:signal transduction histidine kinase